MRFGDFVADGRNLQRVLKNQKKTWEVDTLTSSRSGEEYYVDSLQPLKNLYLGL